MSKLDRFKQIYDFYHPGIFKKFIYHFDEQFKGVELNGKTILEVGCGKGFVSMWIALSRTPKKLLALDEAEGVGGEKDVFAFLKKCMQDFEMTSMEAVKSDIMVNNFSDNSFDIIISNNALHHVVRTRKYISKDEETRQKWIELFVELRRLLKPGGQLILEEFSRNNIWRFSPVKLRFKQIEWEIHPTLKEWLLVIKSASFEKIAFAYTVPYKLRKFKSLFSNSMGAFLLNSTFDIYAQK